MLRGTALGLVARRAAGRRRGARLVRVLRPREEGRPGTPAEFGKGAIEGVAGPESANNAAAQTSFIPLLTLGIPSNAVMALMIGAMIIHDIQPGPHGHDQGAGAVLGPDHLDVGRQPDAGDPEPAADRHLGEAAAGSPTVSSISAILSFCCIGVYHGMQQPRSTSGRRRSSACSATSCIKLDCEPAPLLLGFVLGPMMEENFRRALLIADGNYGVFVSSPISLGLLVTAALLAAVVLVPAIRTVRKTALQED